MRKSLLIYLYALSKRRALIKRLTTSQVIDKCEVSEFSEYTRINRNELNFHRGWLLLSYLQQPKAVLLFEQANRIWEYVQIEFPLLLLVAILDITSQCVPIHSHFSILMGALKW